MCSGWTSFASRMIVYVVGIGSFASGSSLMQDLCFRASPMEM